MLKEAAMVSVILALLLLNIITPALMGQGETDFSTIPLLLIDVNEEELKIYIKGALSDTRYSVISILVDGRDNRSYSTGKLEYESFTTKLTVKLNDSSDVWINTTAYVEENEWWFNCTTRVEEFDESITLWISSEDEDGIVGNEVPEDPPFRQRLFLRRR